MSILAAIPIIGAIIDKIPNLNDRAKAKADLETLEATGELQIMLGQLKINKEEAKHESIYVSGWRPTIGWICGFAFGYHFLFYPLIQTIVAVSGEDISGFPVFDLSQVLTVLLGMLGMSSLRGIEKYKNRKDNSYDGKDAKIKKQMEDKAYAGIIKTFKNGIFDRNITDKDITDAYNGGKGWLKASDRMQLLDLYYKRNKEELEEQIRLIK